MVEPDVGCDGIGIAIPGISGCLAGVLPFVFGLARVARAGFAADGFFLAAFSFAAGFGCAGIFMPVIFIACA